MKPAKRVQARREDGALFGAVLGGQTPEPRRAPWRGHAMGWLLALGVHLALLVMANRVEPSLETWSARVAALIHEELALQAPIAIEVPPTPEPESMPVALPAPLEAVETPPRSAPGEVRPETSPNRTSASNEQPAWLAAAASIVAAETELSGPVDLTDNTFVTGTASAYVGGASVREGAHRTPAPESAERAVGPAPSLSRLSRARPVQLPENEWRCDWPEAAVGQDIYEQFVILRVVVGADGTLERAALVSDPGHGFGPATVACARRTRFTPARDHSGQPIRATSPPIRVRFTR